MSASDHSSTREHVAFVCVHVLSGEEPILFVARDEDWQYLCGGVHLTSDEIRIIHREHVVELDETLSEVADLPVDWEAERVAKGGEWTRRPSPPDDDEE